MKSEFEAAKPPPAEPDFASLRAPVPPKLEVVEPVITLDDLRLDPSVLEGIAVKIPLSIPVRRPPKQEFIRVRPEPAFRVTVGAIDLKEEGEFYVLGGDMSGQFLGTEGAIYTLFVTINRAGALRLWPVRQPGNDGRQNEWHRTAMKAAEYAMRSWVRVVPNKSIGGYEVMEAAVRVPDPAWPDLTMDQIVQVALIDRGLVVTSPEHPIIRKLEGRL